MVAIFFALFNLYTFAICLIVNRCVINTINVRILGQKEFAIISRFCCGINEMFLWFPFFPVVCVFVSWRERTSCAARVKKLNQGRDWCTEVIISTHSIAKTLGAYHLAKKSGNSGLKSNGKVIFRKFRSEIVEYLQRYSSVSRPFPRGLRTKPPDGWMVSAFSSGLCKLSIIFCCLASDDNQI